jgi:hypothetical protein
LLGACVSLSGFYHDDFYKGTEKESRTSRTAAGDKDLGRVGLVLLDAVQDHVGNRLAVAAAEVAQRRLAGHVPARAAMRTARPDGDVPLLVGTLLPRDLAVLGVRLCGRLARVDHDDEGRVGLDVVGDVDVPDAERQISTERTEICMQRGGSEGVLTCPPWRLRCSGS